MSRVDDISASGKARVVPQRHERKVVSSLRTDDVGDDGFDNNDDDVVVYGDDDNDYADEGDDDAVVYGDDDDDDDDGDDDDDYGDERMSPVRDKSSRQGLPLIAVLQQRVENRLAKVSCAVAKINSVCVCVCVCVCVSVCN